MSTVRLTPDQIRLLVAAAEHAMAGEEAEFIDARGAQCDYEWACLRAGCDALKAAQPDKPKRTTRRSKA